MRLPRDRDLPEQIHIVWVATVKEDGAELLARAPQELIRDLGDVGIVVNLAALWKTYTQSADGHGSGS
jgi:hypothetical protein